MDNGKRKKLECALCCGRFNNPKLLDCLHSFCAECIKKHKASNSSRVKPTSKAHEVPRVLCPVCRQETDLPAGVDGLKTNVYLIGLIDEIVMQEQVANCGDAKLSCGSCEDSHNSAVSRCLDCALYLCAGCERAHTRFAALSSHTIATLDEIKHGVVEVSKARVEIAPKCRRHYGETLTLLCETCQELICHDCTLVDHSEARYHKYVDINTAFLDRKQSLGELFPALHYAVMMMEESLENALELNAGLSTSCDEAVKDIRQRAAEMKDMVAAEEKRMIEDIQKIKKDRSAKFQEFTSKMNGKKERIQHSLTTARNLTSTATKTDFISLHSTISKDLQALGTQRPPKIDARLGFLKFASSNEIDGRINLGNLVMEGKWEVCRQFGKEGNGEGDFSCARGIAALPIGEIAVADQWNKRVVICSTDGTLKKTIPTEDYPFDVATFNHQLIVTDTTNYVKVFNTDKTLAFDFATVPAAEVGKTRVNLASVVVKRDGTIVVGDIQRRVVTEHRPADGSLIRTIPVDTPPHYLAIDNATGRLLVSGADKRVLDVVDDAGATLLSIRPRVANDRVEYCTGVCCDSSGIFLAMHNGGDTGHIHHYDSTGKFRACIAHDLHYPMNIKVCPGKQQLAVADWTSVKIFQLEHI
ncbi:E3 ubiquitin-protein ligase TRIM33-like isoform X3 [Acanthaster planci]|nr:E3 ubiquitin-protein ligase TRIM33-like isoform X3 [Acanthaster planci]